jgi:hypothetical protein
MPTTILNQRRWEDEIVVHRGAKERVVENQDKSPTELVWSAMTQMYGDQWINKHGERPPEVWRRALNDMPRVRIGRGIRETLRSGSEFPPSLPKFLEYSAATFEELNPPSLPKPPGDRALALESIEKMKEILGVK